MSKNFKLKQRAGRTGAELACGSKDMKSVSGQSGRSMVEMLGVLAIIGVLSIGGIAGYRMAMDRHHANEWLNGYNQFKVELEAYEHQHDREKEDYVVSLNGFDLYNRNGLLRDFGFPPLYSKGACKMIFEVVDPCDEIDTGISIWLHDYSAYAECDQLGESSKEELLKFCDDIENFNIRGTMGV